MSGRWWRAYDEALDDPKLLLLSDKQHRAWFNLMCLASISGGALPDLKVIAVKLRMPPVRAETILSELRDAGLIDVSETEARPHNWNGRQYKSDVSSDRVKQFRKRQRNVSPAVSETPPDNRVQNTDTDSSLRSENAHARASPQFEQFWQRFPNKVGKRDAEKSFSRIMKSGHVEITQLMTALDRYVNKTDDRPWCNPSTWLNQGRWDDQPAAGGHNGKSVIAALDRLQDRLEAGSVDYVPSPDDLLSLPPR